MNRTKPYAKASTPLAGSLTASTTRMRLYLSNNSPLNATIVDESGQERYSVETPWRWSRRTTTIKKVSQITYHEPRNSAASFTEPLSLLDSPVTVTELPPPSYSKVVVDTYAFSKNELAQIHWHCISSSRLKFAGIEYDLREYLVRSGLLGRLRTFTAPDGQSYQWSMHLGGPVLYRNDENQDPIARLNRRRIGIPGVCKARDPFLEILPAGEHIVDAIVMTFIYVQKRRKDKLRAARQGGGE